MKRPLLIFIFSIFLTGSNLYAQLDKNGNPIFNSEKIENFSFENVEIISNYYTIKDNIDNKQSSVFISENPTLDNYWNFSCNLPSYYFMVVDKGNVKGMLMLIPKKEDDSFFYNVVIPNKNESFQIPSKLKGRITENRAKELADFNKTKAIINNGILKFNNKDFQVLKYNDVIEEVKNIVKEKFIDNQDDENSSIENYIKSESKGGKLDFKNTVEKYEGAFINFDGIMYNKKDFAILMWGAAVKKTGITELNKAKLLWEEINERNLTEPELKALRKGFETKF
ncbi:hypothetical protein SAMN05444360_102322 [Chryseobacterium carnipullorum]|uniref:hypothetical protein n=1 Tax=Chryseobacterium carnipullorum TaxID=1124835 RepID=UPI0009162E44|nr:hypothetical protein [Chryseobacterium carnipullorum]SHL55967.1 hypothetical protein SAMN05444360_102322 [Chryseobacterium carnipullorum]